MYFWKVEFVIFVFVVIKSYIFFRCKINLFFVYKNLKFYFIMVLVLSLVFYYLNLGLDEGF